MKPHLKMFRGYLTESEQCDTLEAVLHVFPPTSASVTPGSYLVRVAMRPGLVLLCWCSLCPPAHSVLSRGRPPIDTVHAPPWFMSHLSRLMFLSPKTGCSRLAFCTALRGHCLGMPRSTVIKLHQVGNRVVPITQKTFNTTQTKCIKEYLCLMLACVWSHIDRMQGLNKNHYKFFSLECWKKMWFYHEIAW